MTDTPPAAPHTPSDDPRVEMLDEARINGELNEESDRRDLLARLDAAAPARDAALVPELWWSPEDGPIVRETREGSAFYGEYRPANTVRWMTELPANAVRLAVASDFRDRLGATTNDEPGRAER